MSLVTLGAESRLSESILWTMQFSFFDEVGLEAWKVLPVYPTANMTFCSTYADMLVAYLLDVENDLDSSYPLYILEVGGGTGCFAYRFLNELSDKLASFERLRQFEIRYVLSDCTPTIVHAWKENRRLARYRDSGVLDLAVFNIGYDQELRLLNSGEVIRKGSLRNPLVLIANYLFDSLPHDAFRVENGVLKEVRYTVAREVDEAKREQPVTFDQIRLIEKYADISTNYYPEQEFNSILEFYRANLTEASVIFPIGGLRMLNSVREFSSKLLLLASDKGFTSPKSRQILGLWAQQFEVRGCACFDVNFDAVARYLLATKGFVLLEPGDHLGLNTIVGCVADKPQTKLENLKYYFAQHLSRKDPLNSLNNFYRSIGKTVEVPEDDEQAAALLISIIKSLNYEPDAMLVPPPATLEKLEKFLAGIDDQRKDEIVEIMNRLARNIFERAEFYLHTIFGVMIVMRRHPQLLHLLNELSEVFGPLPTISDHFALCFLERGELELAFAKLTESLSLDPTNQWTRQTLDHVRQRMSAAQGKATPNWPIN